ncbi:MAG: hypothetical protein KC776_15635 [Myxococcales bacterium]|nr:hypothetical protein [Myxococcales bacterium]MCB9578315.1 hypothetical protein [Polyangiaceae bacterium]
MRRVAWLLSVSAAVVLSYLAAVPVTLFALALTGETGRRVMWRQPWVVEAYFAPAVVAAKSTRPLSNRYWATVEEAEHMGWEARCRVVNFRIRRTARGAELVSAGAMMGGGCLVSWRCQPPPAP